MQTDQAAADTELGATDDGWEGAAHAWQRTSNAWQRTAYVGMFCIALAFWWDGQKKKRS